MGPGTAVEFRTGVADPLAYAGTWLRKAVAHGARVRVIGRPAELSALNHVLWVADKEGFLPHATAGADHDRPGMARTAIWLGAGAVAGPSPQLLLNLGASIPDDWGDYQRIVEIVADDEAQVQAGRERWAGYCRLGTQPIHRPAGGDDGAP